MVLMPECPLERLALERQRHAGGALIGLAHDGAECVDPLAGGILAGVLRSAGASAGASTNDSAGITTWPASLAGNFAFALRERGTRGENDRCDGAEKSRAHVRLLLADPRLYADGTLQFCEAGAKRRSLLRLSRQNEERGR